ncbi:MAG: ABC transporter substrate-binding protein [Pseudohaliea sp.]
MKDPPGRVRARLIAGFALLLLACTVRAGPGEEVREDPVSLAVATTTVSSGLMAALLPAFEADTGYRVALVSSGSGRVLRTAREGGAELTITHLPEAEQRFMADGFGERRELLMTNEFVVAGPAGDPAGVAEAGGAAPAFRAIARTQALFVSRGDDSGTHRKELALWAQAGVEPFGPWYFEYGHGMGRTLELADQRGAYVLVDRGTWAARRETLGLRALLSEGEALFNPYHIILVNPVERGTAVRAAARRLFQWLSSGPGQAIIGAYTVGGEHPFRAAS